MTATPASGTTKGMPGADGSAIQAPGRKAGLRGVKGDLLRQEHGSAFGALLQKTAKGEMDKPEAASAKVAAAKDKPDAQSDDGGAALAETLSALEIIFADKPDPSRTDPQNAGFGPAAGQPARDGRATASMTTGPTGLAALNAALLEAAISRPSDARMTDPRITGAAAGDRTVPSEDDTQLDVGKSPSGNAALEATSKAQTQPADARRGDGQVGTLRFSVIHQETHLPPIERNLLLNQVSGPIREAAAELADAARTGMDADLGRREITTPAKVLHIELHPAELGSLVVKMRLAQDRMEMRIEASNPATAAMLAQDEASLRDIVRASGYEPDTIVIETATIDQPGDAGSTRDRQDGSQDANGDQADQRRDLAGPFGERDGNDRDGRDGRTLARRDEQAGNQQPSSQEPHHDNRQHDSAQHNDMARQGRAGDRRLYL